MTSKPEGIEKYFNCENMIYLHFIRPIYETCISIYCTVSGCLVCDVNFLFDHRMFVESNGIAALNDYKTEDDSLTNVDLCLFAVDQNRLVLTCLCGKATKNIHFTKFFITIFDNI